MFIAGKNTELLSFPARYVLSRLQEAKKTPITMQDAKFLPRILLDPFLRKRKSKNDIAKQNVNATKINEFSWYEYAELWCIFWTTPSPPDEIKANIRGGKYEIDDFLSDFDSLLIPEITRTGIAIKIPSAPKTVIFSSQNTAPDRVGIKKPKEYIVAQRAIFPFDKAIV